MQMMKPLLSCAFAALSITGALAQTWNGYGGNAQHSGVFSGTSQTASSVHWQTPLDDDRNYYGGSVLIHYASPMVTLANTVVYGYRWTGGGGGVAQYDHWRVIARSGATGAQMWQLDTDFSAAIIFPNDWTSVFPVTLCQMGASLPGVLAPAGGSANSMGMAVAAAGGSILVRASADALGSSTARYVFYTNLADYNANQAAYAPVKICTPLTADNTGNIYFGYEVTGAVPPNLANLGTGGIARVNASTGQAVYASVQTLGIDNSLSRPAINAAPAISLDGGSVYVALTGGVAVLAKLTSSTLTPTASVKLFDPSIPTGSAYLINESSASPMVGPDGHVFMGVFGNQWRESHGWMLQFDGNLKQTNAAGKRYPVGAFGWDDTASVVPAVIVAGYRGTSQYLILTKYNNYDDNGSDPGADGSNLVAVLDPGSDSKAKDRQSGIPVMNEVLTVLGPTRTNNDSQHPNARNEWCINMAAIDVNRKAAIINSEDGHMYRWSFTTNSLTEALNLQPATGEAYTSTSIGPDGQLYVINNSILFAIGSSKATAVSVYQGTPGKGTLSDIWYLDGLCYSTGSVAVPSYQAAAIEADFVLPATAGTTLNVTASVAATPAVTGFVYAFNYSTQSFVLIATHTLATGQTSIGGTITSNAFQYIGPGGQVRVLVRGMMPSRLGSAGYTLSLDFATCGTG